MGSGERDGQSAASPPIVGLLLENLGGEVPRQDQSDIRLSLRKQFRAVYRYVMSRGQQALLERTAIDDPRQALRSDAAIGQQGVGLGGRAVTRQAFTVVA